MENCTHAAPLTMDWVTIDGFNAHHPPAVIGQGYMTAFYYRALQDARRVALLAGDTTRAARYTELQDDTRIAFNRELWNPENGLYRDGKPFQTSVKPNEWLPADPTHFVPLTAASVSCDGGTSELQLSQKGGGVLENGAGVKAARVAAIRFTFYDGSRDARPGLGFNVYRESSVSVKPQGGS